MSTREECKACDDLYECGYLKYWDRYCPDLRVKDKDAEIKRLTADNERIQKQASTWKTRADELKARVAELEGVERWQQLHNDAPDAAKEVVLQRMREAGAVQPIVKAWKAKLSEAEARVAELEGRARAVWCVWCGEGIAFVPGDDVPAAHARMKAHDQSCPKNPLVARVAEREAERVLKVGDGK